MEILTFSEKQKISSTHAVLYTKPDNRKYNLVIIRKQRVATERRHYFLPKRNNNAILVIEVLRQVGVGL